MIIEFLKNTIIVVITTSLFISCYDNSKVISEIESNRQEPIGTALNIRMVYTDSLKIQAILTAPKHVDYTNLDFRYAEFPEGLKVVFLMKMEMKMRF